MSRVPGFEWTRIEAVVEGGKLTYYVNGKLVNAASDATLQRGADHDPVGRGGDLFPPDRASAAAVGERYVDRRLEGSIEAGGRRTLSQWSNGRLKPRPPVNEQQHEPRPTHRPNRVPREVHRQDNQRDGDIEDEPERQIVVEHRAEAVVLVERPVNEKPVRHEQAERSDEQQPHSVRARLLESSRPVSSDRPPGAAPGRACPSILPRQAGFRRELLQQIRAERPLHVGG